MSLRLRLALAFLLLSALPLGGFALYSYSSSSAALRRAAEAEASELARDLATRVESVAEDLDRSIRVLARVPAEAWATSEAESDPRIEAALADLGPALEFVEGFSFVPGPAPAAPPRPATAPAPAAAPAPPAPPRPAVEFTFGVGSSGHRRATGLSEAQREELRRELAKVREQIAKSLREAAVARAAGADAAPIEEAVRAQRLAMRELEKLAAGAPVGAAVGAPAPQGAEGAVVRWKYTFADGGEKGPIPGGFTCDIESGDRVVGQIQAKVKASDLLRTVLAQTDRERGEIPFALDGEGQLYVAESDDATRLRDLPALAALRRGEELPGRASDGDWIVVARQDPATEFRYGIARPLSRPMAELKRATARNFTFGMALVGLALVGMVPVSTHLVRNVRRLEDGASRIAAGDLAARVPVTSRDELGRLAVTFNRMAEQLAEHQDRLIEQERLRKEEEISRRLLAAENERRRRELEEARDFQLSLLPRELPRRDGFDLAVSMTTATEVGGDYYDFLDGPSGRLVLAVGDATGHGAAAGTMVTAVKGLFAGGAGEVAPAAFLRAANAAVHRMGLVRRAMALTVARLEGRRLVLSAAGMPPALHHAAARGAVSEIALAGTPLGARADFPYAEAAVDLAPGDAVLFVSDGLPELPNAAGEPFGYERLAARFAELAAGDARAIVAGLESSVAAWSPDRPPADDVTFLVLKAL
jgi:serine phosphatase RsbU (regulator of sigma subunit)